jgi:hypothetical protein
MKKMKTIYYNTHYKFPVVKLTRIKKPKYQGIVNTEKKVVPMVPDLFSVHCATK